MSPRSRRVTPRRPLTSSPSVITATEGRSPQRLNVSAPAASRLEQRVAGGMIRPRLLENQEEVFSRAIGGLKSGLIVL